MCIFSPGDLLLSRLHQQKEAWLFICFEKCAYMYSYVYNVHTFTSNFVHMQPGGFAAVTPTPAKGRMAVCNLEEEGFKTAMVSLDIQPYIYIYIHIYLCMVILFFAKVESLNACVCIGRICICIARVCVCIGQKGAEEPTFGDACKTNHSHDMTRTKSQKINVQIRLFM
jgi:hypothetical protein